MLGYLKKKVLDRFKNWDRKMLRKGIKEILIKKKSGQTIPNYATYVFLSPL